MLPSLLCACLYALSGICGQRAAVAYGSLRANAIRLVIAMLCLALMAWKFGALEFNTVEARWLLVSGAVGFGLGDMALFLAYPRLGSRLTLLLMLCAAPLCGSLGDWWLLGTIVSPHQALAAVVILAGVVLALSQGVRVPRLDAAAFIPGVVFAILAGLGQGFGAALSRYAQSFADGGLHLNGISQAFVRVVAGAGVSTVFWLLHASWSRPAASAGTSASAEDVSVRSAPVWLVGTALFGPVLGVSCFQWALLTSKSAVVLAITAITPVLVMPLAAYVERDEPGVWAVIGGLIAVSGVVLMSFWLSV